MLFNNDFYLCIPEIYLIISITGIIWLSVLYTNLFITVGKLLSVQVGWVTFGIILIVSVLYSNLAKVEYVIFGGSMLLNDIIKIFLILAIIGFLSIIILSINYVKINSLNVYELFLIFLLIFSGFLVLILSNDFLVMYVGIELQSLGLYILATLKQNSIFATEAGLKYFVLGAFASCLLILGISIIYSVTGLINFADFNLFFIEKTIEDPIYLSFLIGLLFIIASLLFKVGSAPFHIWLPDVYEGVATIITAFFAILPKLIIFNIFIKILFIVCDMQIQELYLILLISSLMSIIIGAIGAVYQVTIKRMLSYSAISHTGFILMGFVVNSLEGLVSVVFYITVYVIILINIFSILLQTQQKATGTTIKYIENLGYIYKSNKILGSALIFGIFSLAGIPPLSGFFSKLYLFIATIKVSYIIISLCMVVLTVISAVYYLKIIRNSIFIKKKKKNYLLHEISGGNAYIIMYTAIINSAFMLVGTNLLYFCYNISLSFLY